uniref:Uncharacterized protein n=1 Tax=Sphaerodactylus townsendi TaxID=933632 RepID=A0ACB8ER23_9SAUR
MKKLDGREESSLLRECLLVPPALELCGKDVPEGCLVLCSDASDSLGSCPKLSEALLLAALLVVLYRRSLPELANQKLCKETTTVHSHWLTYHTAAIWGLLDTNASCLPLADLRLAERHQFVVLQLW